MQGAQTCEGGHAQTEASSYDLLTALRTTRAATSATALDAVPAADIPVTEATNYARPLHRAQARPQLHISGFDPRAAGGLQTLKMELRGMPDACAQQLALQLQ